SKTPSRRGRGRSRWTRKTASATASRRSFRKRARSSSGPRVRVPSRRSRPSSRRGSLALLLVLTLTLGACASARPVPPLPADVEAARARLEDAWQSCADLGALAEIAIRQRARSQRFTGALLLRRPSSLRFEALSPFGPPLLVVAARPEPGTIWEVAAGRGYLL